LLESTFSASSTGAKLSVVIMTIVIGSVEKTWKWERKLAENKEGDVGI
jgi:hypothetical protein